MKMEPKNNSRTSCDRKARERDEATPEAWKIEERLSLVELLKKEKKKTLLELAAGSGKDSQFFKKEHLKRLVLTLASLVLFVIY